MRCSDCNQPIADDDLTATGPDGVIHYACFKRGTAHGEAIDLSSLHETIGMLKKRVQDLERVTKAHEQTLEHHRRNIPFRIG